jgi:hypothetical protein
MISSHSDVTFFAKTFSPLILYNPIIFFQYFIVTIANNKNSMISTTIALGIENTLFIVNPGIIDMNSNSNRSVIVKSRFQSILISVWFDRSPARNKSLRMGFFIFFTYIILKNSYKNYRYS